MYWTGKSMNNLLPYCGLVDARIRASNKDLPVLVSAWKLNFWENDRNLDRILNHFDFFVFVFQYGRYFVEQHEAKVFAGVLGIIQSLLHGIAGFILYKGRQDTVS